MARANAPLLTFNRGRISPLALARVDLDRTRLSADIQTNMIPRTLGSMMLRPGLEHVIGTHSERVARLVPFVFSSTDTALLECTTTRVRLHVNDKLVQRTLVSSQTTNGQFNSSTTLLGWTDADDTGASSTWVTGSRMELQGTKFASARRRQEVAVASTDASKEHGIRVNVERGHPILKVGSASGNDDYVEEVELGVGTYSFACTPSSNIHLELASNTEYSTLVNSIKVESTADGLSPSGVVDLPAPWSASQLDDLRWDQSGDIIYMAIGSTIAQRKIERFGKGSSTSSWALSEYAPEDGPFRNPNITSKRLTAYGRTGNVILECDQPLFDKTGHIGALFRITSIGQDTTVSANSADTFSAPIRVSGVDDARKFDIIVYSAGSTVATVRVQRSVGEVGNWGDVSALVFNSSSTTTHDDGLDNQIIFYRIGVGATDYASTSSQTVEGQLSYDSGGLVGVVKVNTVTSSTFTNSTAAQVSVLQPLGSTAATETWDEGAWSIKRGFPSAVGFHEGRLWWGGKNKVVGSVSDGFESFDPDIPGDSAPINRSIAAGPADKIRWVMSLGRLITGTEGNEWQVKTGTLEEPLTPTNFNLREISGQGSANVQAVKVDKSAYFVAQGKTRIYRTGYSGKSLDYESADTTVLVPEIGEPSITKMAVQRQPDTRIHCVRGSTDGTVALLVSEPAENVSAWVNVETGDADGVNGVIEDVAVLPSTGEDAVYYVVKRVVGGSPVRYIERWAEEHQARGGANNKIADSFVTQNSTATTVVTGLDHLIGESVIAWGATKDLGAYTVVVSSAGSSRGQVTLDEASTTSTVGLPYNGWFKSAKLAYAAQAGSPVTQPKKVTQLGLVLANVHQRGLQFGPATSTDTYPMDSLPSLKEGATQSTDAVHEVYDEKSVIFPGTYNTDSRIVLKATAPRPVTVLGAIVGVETKERI